MKYTVVYSRQAQKAILIRDPGSHGSPFPPSMHGSGSTAWESTSISPRRMLVLPVDGSIFPIEANQFTKDSRF